MGSPHGDFRLLERSSEFGDRKNAIALFASLLPAGCGIIAADAAGQETGAICDDLSLAVDGSFKGMIQCGNGASPSASYRLVTNVD
jgi:hypothetical protein